MVDACLLELVWEAESRKINHGCLDASESPAYQSSTLAHASGLRIAWPLASTSTRSALLHRTGLRAVMTPRWHGRTVRRIVCTVRRVIPAFLFDDYLAEPMVSPIIPRTAMFSSPFCAYLPPPQPSELPPPCEPKLEALREYGMLVVQSRSHTV